MAMWRKGQIVGGAHTEGYYLANGAEGIRTPSFVTPGELEATAQKDGKTSHPWSPNNVSELRVEPREVWWVLANGCCS